MPPLHVKKTSGKPATERTGLARALSKLGYCSRSQAVLLVRDARVRVDGRQVLDPERRVDWNVSRIEVDGQVLRKEQKVYLMLNKPRGLVTTAADEKGRGTVFDCLSDKKLPFVSPVGRLDQASEGLLLFTNDTHWAARITGPENHVDKTYHVQIDAIADDGLISRLRDGVTAEGERLTVKRAGILRTGEKNSWLEIVVDEGKNRHIRRLLDSAGVGVIRLIRIAIGSLSLGTLAKGEIRFLSDSEINNLARSV
jgi:23S rRNA pseudouridine2605 synthase